MSVTDVAPDRPTVSLDRALLALTAVALFARIAFLMLEPTGVLAGDEPSWIEIGRRLFRPTKSWSPLDSDLIFYPPVYPYFIGLLYRVEHSFRTVLWAQVLLGALTVPAIGRAGAWAFGRRTGLLAAALTAVYPEFLWYPAHYWSETVYLVLLWWAIERTLATDPDRSVGRAIAAGVLFGLATLTREISMYLVPIAALWLLRPAGAGTSGRPRRLARLRPRPGALAAAAALVLAAALTVVPWTIRNAITFRAFIPVSTMGGLNLWQGNTRITHLEIYEILKTKGSMVEQDRFCREMAWREIAARQPLWIFEKLGEQMPEFWKAGAEALDHYLARHACGPVSERGTILLELVFVVPYLVLLVLGLIGLARLRWTPSSSFLLVLLGAYTLAHAAAYATTRFRLPILPIVFMLASLVFVGAKDSRVTRLRGWRLAVLAALTILTLAALTPGLDELLTWHRLTGRPMTAVTGASP